MQTMNRPAALLKLKADLIAFVAAHNLEGAKLSPTELKVYETLKNMKADHNNNDQIKQAYYRMHRVNISAGGVGAAMYNLREAGLVDIKSGWFLLPVTFQTLGEMPVVYKLPQNLIGAIKAKKLLKHCKR